MNEKRRKELLEKQYIWMPCLELFQKDGAKVEAANRKDKKRKIQEDSPIRAFICL